MKHSPQRRPALAGGRCSCSTQSLASPSGEIIVLRVVGDVDLDTLPILQTALSAALARHPAHLLVHLARTRFCSVGGLALLVRTGRTAAESGTGYAISAVSRRLDRILTLLWSDDDLPIRHRTAAAGVATAGMMAATATAVRGHSAATIGRRGAG